MWTLKRLGLLAALLLLLTACTAGNTATSSSTWDGASWDSAVWQ